MSKLSSLWQKIDELGTDENKPTMAEITAMVIEARHLAVSTASHKGVQAAQ